MKFVVKSFATLAVIALGIASYVAMRDDGGVVPVLRDEVPPLARDWFGFDHVVALRYASFVPSALAVAAGFRAGDADYDKSGPFREQLTQGIPLHYWADVMQHDNLSAAMRARNRQLVRIASDNTEQRFFDMFPRWWASHTACMTPEEKLDTIRSLAPAIAARIDAKNAEFEALAAKEIEGTLTVSERAAYLADDLRVPHLVQLPATSFQLGGRWIEVDPAEPFSRHESKGPLVRECPNEDHSPGWHIKACFGYVAIDIYRSTGQWPGYGHHTPTILGRAVHRNLQPSSAARDFVLQMMEEKNEQATLRTLAEHIVASLPATEVSSGAEEWRVTSEYKRLRCGG